MFQPKLHTLRNAYQRWAPAQQTVLLHLWQPTGDLHAVTVKIDFHTLAGLTTGDNAFSQRLHLLTLRIPQNFAKWPIGKRARRTKTAKQLFSILLFNQRVKQLLIKLIAG